MYFSAERLALANRKVLETFEQCSVAWQAIPHWDTGDPSQTQVPNDNVTAPKFVSLTPPVTVPFTVSLAVAIAPTPDLLLANVIANTVKLATKVDKAVFTSLRTAAPMEQFVSLGTQDMLNALIKARADVETAGYRAPSCLVANTKGYTELTKLTSSGVPGTDVLLPPTNVNCLQRVAALETIPPSTGDAVAYLLGRRQRIACGGAMDASPGEEALDLAVSIAPSMEVVGEAIPPNINTIQLNVRLGYALRIKDANGYVAILNPL
ncbi:hypothetical protein ACQ86B_08760 [Mycolicibacterium aichiense]|uniref:hypothetical protein n=1 Tax=Mycolicibacterium aichiense TaxID=1799 RepID=UPI003D67E817